MLLSGRGEEGIWNCSVIQAMKNQRRPEVCRDKYSPFRRGGVEKSPLKSKNMLS